MLYEQAKDAIVHCYLCPHHCMIQPGERGKCGVRENDSGTLYSLVYGTLCARSVDPIEKKPFFHFLPGTESYSIATVGCNFHCGFCQNWRISQLPHDSGSIAGEEATATEIVDDALSYGCKSISYTYTEPTIFLEFAFDTAKEAKKRGLANTFVSNGYTTKKAIDTISPYLDAINIDLKGFSDEFYRKTCGGRLKPVLDAITRYHENGVWVEITTLIVPGHNDSQQMLEQMADFIASVDTSIPWHISRFHPSYTMQNVPPTDIRTIHKAVEVGKKRGILHIYSGNVPGDDFESTFCPNCGKKLIDRRGFHIAKNHLTGTNCPACGQTVNIIIST